MNNLDDKISLRLKSLKAQIEEGSNKKSNLQKQTKQIRAIAILAAILLVIVLIQSIGFAFNESLKPPPLTNSLLAADLTDLLSPLAIIMSILTATYLGLNQLRDKLNRDKVEHAHNLCSSAPDINIVFASIGPLSNHLGDAYRNCLEVSQIQSKAPANSDPWEVFVTRMEHMAENFPSAIKSIARTLQADHQDDVSKIYEALAFFEKTSIAICKNHADDQVFWSRYNVAGFGIWIYSFPIIINEWFRYTNSNYKSSSNSIGMPFEHFEAWLRYHSDQDHDGRLKTLMARLSRIRSKVLEAK